MGNTRAVSGRTISLRWESSCALCGEILPARTKAVWDAETMSATCLTCGTGGGKTVISVENSLPPLPTEPPRPVPPTHSGTPGASARRTYQRRHERYEQKVSRFGILAPVVKVIDPEPQSTVAWATGAIGEERLGLALANGLGGAATILSDCAAPNSQKNIDFVVIARSGVWVIDAKRYNGLIQVRDVGGWFRTDERLFIGGRDRTKAVDGLSWQVDVVRNALPQKSVTITPVICMVDAEFPLFRVKPIKLRGVWVVWGKKLAEMILEGTAVLSEDQVADVSRTLMNALPPHA